MKSYYVYILSNNSNRVFYTGITSNLVRRVYEHRNKLVEGFTSKYNLSKLVYFEDTASVETALEREKKLKKWRRNFKINLISKTNPDWHDLYDDIV
ncbi:MAG: GIY-YIG nuclease family protein [bacterium]